MALKLSKCYLNFYIAIFLLQICIKTAFAGESYNSNGYNFKPISYKALHCIYARDENVAGCIHGSYYDTHCEKQRCYRGLMETCDRDPRFEFRFGQCAPGLSCKCGVCSGCQDTECILELCKQVRYNNNQI